MSRSLIELARSFLFVPANRIDWLHKALAGTADVVIIDLEDALAPDQKAPARAVLMSHWSSVGEHSRVLLRVNSLDSDDARADIALCQTMQPAGIVVPKVGDSRRLAEVARNFPGTHLLPMVESAAGWHELDAISKVPGVARLVFGNLDFQLDLGMQCARDEAELAPVRLDIVAASRRAGLPAPVDGVTVEIHDAPMTREATLRARRFGFGAKLCIHPRQIDVVHQVLAPSSEDMAWARRVVDAASRSGGSATQVDGTMIDRPIISRAKRMLLEYGQRPTG